MVRFFSNYKSIGLFTLLVLFAILLNRCELDQGLGPLNNKISGQLVYYVSELRPSNIGEVRVAALLNFPPSGLGDIFFSDPLEYYKDTVEYEIYLPEGDYPALVVLWKPVGENWSFNSLLGLYGFEPPDHFEMRAISVTKDIPVIENVNLFALWSFANTDSKINGQISYVGTPPSNTEGVLLITFTRIPDFDNLLLSLLFLGGVPLPVSITDNSFEYQLRVFHGDYKFIGLFWKGFDTPLENIVPIGFYPDPTNPNKLGSFTAPENGSVSGINFIGDFNTLPAGVHPE